MWLDRRTELDKSTTELDAARTTAKNIGHAVEVIKVCLRRGAQCLCWLEKSVSRLHKLQRRKCLPQVMEIREQPRISTGNNTQRTGIKFSDEFLTRSVILDLNYNESVPLTYAHVKKGASFAMILTLLFFSHPQVGAPEVQPVQHRL